ncbi:MAG: hypothetical protein WDN26_12400 [Chitinophagaceae bacterium]
MAKGKKGNKDIKIGLDTDFENAMRIALSQTKMTTLTVTDVETPPARIDPQKSIKIFFSKQGASVKIGSANDIGFTFPLNDPDHNTVINAAMMSKMNLHTFLLSHPREN